MVVTLFRLSPGSTPPTGSQVQEGETAVQMFYTLCSGLDDGLETSSGAGFK